MKDASIIKKLGDQIEAALKLEVGKTHADDVHFRQQLIDRLPLLRELGAKHIQVLNKFKQQNPEVEFPALHKELFSPEGLEMM